MRIKKIHVIGFKRFTDLTIAGIPDTAKLVVLIGANGSGKTSVFEALNHWRRRTQFVDHYHSKQTGAAGAAGQPQVAIDFHGTTPNANAMKSAIYLRTAYRNDADFQAKNISQVSSVVDEEMQRVNLMVNDDKRVQQNYSRIVANTVYELFSEGGNEEMTKAQLREKYIGPLRESMRRVFEDLTLQGVGTPHNGGTFLFKKGQAHGFRYVNLSAGEKDAFDLLLDLHLRRVVFGDSIYCIDEPEMHMHSQLQSRLLGELFALVPETSQLWIATHSIGIIKKALDIQRVNANSISFLDFSNQEYDGRVDIGPAKIDRAFWKTAFSVAIGDMAELVAPKRIVLCEGRPLGTEGHPSRCEHDAKCLRKIFSAQFPDTEFISSGNSNDVARDTTRLVCSVGKLVAGITFIKVVDRDGMTNQQLVEYRNKGVRVLGRRHIESYLLDDQVLATLCGQHNKAGQIEELKRAREAAMDSATKRGNDIDDAKSAAGEFFNSAKKILEIFNPGNNWESFFSEHMAGACVPGQAVYDDLKEAIFGD